MIISGIIWEKVISLLTTLIPSLHSPWFTFFKIPQNHTQTDNAENKRTHLLGRVPCSCKTATVNTYHHLIKPLQLYSVLRFNPWWNKNHRLPHTLTCCITVYPDHTHTRTLTPIAAVAMETGLYSTFLGYFRKRKCENSSDCLWWIACFGKRRWAQALIHSLAL